MRAFALLTLAIAITVLLLLFVVCCGGGSGGSGGGGGSGVDGDIVVIAICSFIRVNLA